MIKSKDFVENIKSRGTEYFIGVPDSLLKDLISFIDASISNEFHISAVNEGNAVAISAGLYMTTGKPQVVYMQNSGLGNAINPLTSLTHHRVYSIPVLLIIGWRGEPGKKDEPQHEVMGDITLSLLDLVGIQYFILEDNFDDQLAEAFSIMKRESKPVAIVVREGTFEKEISHDKNLFDLLREDALRLLLDEISGDDIVVSTTGKSSREIYDLRNELGQSHKSDFLTIGSMGHVTGITQGLVQSTTKSVYCIDGDGSLLMHTGALINLIHSNKDNLKYILINNQSHQSVGGQATIFKDLNETNLLIGLGFREVLIAESEKDLIHILPKFHNSQKTALVIRVSNQSREDLSRPKETPVQNKKEFMKLIGQSK